MEFKNLHQYGVVYQMDLDLVIYQRQVYGILDCLSDLGGLTSGLYAIFTIFIKVSMY